MKATDVTPPNAICPEDQIANTEVRNNMTATVTFAASCEDNIDEDINPNCTATSNVTQFPAGETIVTCSCTDQSDNTQQCAFMVTVKDGTHPTARCPRDKVADATNKGNTTATVSFAATCQDNIDDDLIPSCSARSDDTEFPVGETIVNCSCTDRSNHTHQCSFKITVKDITRPVTRCPLNQVANAENQGNTTAIVSFVATCQDNIDRNLYPNCTAISESTHFSFGETTVTCSCTDKSNNRDNCSFIVAVKDVTNPSAICPNDKTANAQNDGDTTATVNFTAMCRDNVDKDILPNCTAISDETQFLLGETTVNCSCTDQSENSNQCSFKVTVKDATPPAVYCPGDQITNVPNQGHTTATVTFVATCEDNMDGSITPTCNATSDVTPFSVGGTIVTCSCTDVSDNTNECLFLVTVKDVTSPNVTCPSDQIAKAQDQGNTSATVNFSARCHDIIDGDITPNCTATSNVTQFSVGKTIVNCTCADQSENTNQCAFQVIVKDETRPTAICPNDQITDAQVEGNTMATVNFTATCRDNIDENITPNCTAFSDITLFSVGETTVTCSCTDHSDHTSQCSFNVTVKDVTGPVAVCPEDQIANAHDQGYRTATISFTATCVDNIEENIEPNCTAISGETQFPVGVTTVTCSCTDRSNNSNQCHFNLTVNDVTSPNATCPEDQIANTQDESNTTATVSFIARCEDNIDEDILPNCTATSNITQFRAGETNVTCSCTDHYNNTEECFFKVIVKDATHPTAKCPRNQVAHALNQGNTTAKVRFAATCLDNIDKNITPNCSAVSDDTEFPVGETTVSCSCTDQSGYTDRCSFSITVKDITRPTARCPPNQVANAQDRLNTTAIASFGATCQDNFDENIDPNCTAITDLAKFSVGETDVICFCTDHSGNTDTCSFSVTVKDFTDPTAICPDDQIAMAQNNGYTTATVSFVSSCQDNTDENINSNCTAVSDDTQFRVGETAVTCTCTDQSGNTNQCSFKVIVKDVTAPEAICSDDQITTAQNQGNTTARVNFTATCYDNVDETVRPICTAASNYTEFAVGVTTVTCSCIDQSDNFNQCSFNVTVIDTTRPTAICPEDKTTYAQNQGFTTASVSFVAKCQDNIDEALEPNCTAITNDTQFPVGDKTVFCECTDHSFNLGRCSFNVKVKDITPPTVTCPEDQTTNAQNQDNTTATISFVAKCLDNIDETLKPNCSAISEDTQFPVGDTRVTCQCTDQSFNMGKCSFNVKVRATHCQNENDEIRGVLLTFRKSEMNRTVESEEKCTSGMSRAIRNCSWSQAGAVWSNYEIIKCYELPQSGQSNTTTNVQAFVKGYLEDQENKTVTSGVVGAFVKDLTDVVEEIKNNTEEISDNTIADLTGQLDKAIQVKNQTKEVKESIINTFDKLVDILGDKQKTDTSNKIEDDEKQGPNEDQGSMEQHDQGNGNQNEDTEDLSKENSEAILQLLEHHVQSVGESGDNLTVIGDNFDVHVRQINTTTASKTKPIVFRFKRQSRKGGRVRASQKGSDGKEEEGGDFQGNTDRAPEDQETNGALASLEIPPELVEDHFKDDAEFPLSVVLHHDNVLFQDEVTKREGKAIASVVLSASTPKEIKNLTVPIVLVFDLKKPEIPDMKEEDDTVKSESKSDKCAHLMKYKQVPVCVFWDHNKTGGSGWSTEGCDTFHKQESNVAECRCNHLTNFAVLMDLQGDVENVGLDIFSKIGCGISIVSLCITIVTFLCIKKLRNSRPQQIVLQICIALLGLYVTFLAGIDRTEVAIVCDVITGLIHFFCLASVAWMSVEATNMYLLFVKVHNHSSRFFMLIASSFAWGLPACVVITNAIVQIMKHGGKQKYDSNRQYLSACTYCFLDHTSRGFLFGMVGILAILLSYNLLLFAMVSWKLTIGRKRVQTSSANKRQETLRRLQNVFAISVLMGITWLSGFFSFGQLQLMSNIIFCVSNSLQGCLIFFLFCVRQKDIRSAWKNSVLARSLSSQRSRTSRRATKMKPVKEDSKVPNTGDSSEMSKFATGNNYEDLKTISETLATKQHTDSALEATLDESVYMEPTMGSFDGAIMSPPPDLICSSSHMTTFKGHVGQLIDVTTNEDGEGRRLAPTNCKLDVTYDTTLVITPSTPTSIHESLEQSSLYDSDDEELEVQRLQYILSEEHPYAMIRADASKADTPKRAPVLYDSDSSSLLRPPRYSMR